METDGDRWRRLDTAPPTLLSTCSETPELEELVISREGMAYRYEVTPGWQRTGDGERAFRELIRALGPLLVDLTGPIVIRRLAQLEPLRDRGMLSMEEVAAWLRGERQLPETPERPRPAWPDDVTYDQS